MSSDSCNSALFPLAPLERWIQFTQTEIIGIRGDLEQTKSSMQAAQTIQIQQITSLQAQLDDLKRANQETRDRLHLFRAEVSDCMSALQFRVDNPERSNRTFLDDVALLGQRLNEIIALTKNLCEELHQNFPNSTSLSDLDAIR